MAKTIVGLFDDRSTAEGAVRDLIDAGIARDRISVVANNEEGKVETQKVDEHGNMAGEGAATGAGAGLVVGGIAGLLIGLGFTVLPVAGLLLAGPIAGALAGAAAGIATGGILGALIGMGIPKEHADVYAEGIRRGGTLVTVQNLSDAEADRAEDILDRDGAVDIDERAAEYRAEGFTGYDPDAKPITTEQAQVEGQRVAESVEPPVDRTRIQETTVDTRNDADNERIPIVEERMNVDKQAVQKGGVRVRTYVTEEPVNQDVRLQQEHVNVERRPVDRPADPNAMGAFQEGTIEVTERAEVPVVQKEARVVEEVVVNKTADQRTETVNDTVRRTNVDVEPIGGLDQESWFRQDFEQRYPGARYEEYAPAYQYGSQLSSDPMYASAGWKTVEPVAMQRWEAHNPGTWARYRDAIFASWQRSRASSNRARML